MFEIALWDRDATSYVYKDYGTDLDAASCELGDYVHDVNNTMLGICVTSKGKL